MLTSLNELVLLVHVGTACLKIQVPHVQYLRVCACVFITPCLHAAALPTGIRSFRHIFTSSAFKGINIALTAVAGLNGWLGGKEGGWMSNAIPSLFLPCLCLPLSFFFFFFLLLWYGTTWGVRRGDAVVGSPQGRDPEATAPACVLCLQGIYDPFHLHSH